MLRRSTMPRRPIIPYWRTWEESYHTMFYTRTEYMSVKLSLWLTVLIEYIKFSGTWLDIGVLFQFCIDGRWFYVPINVPVTWALIVSIWRAAWFYWQPNCGFHVSAYWACHFDLEHAGCLACLQYCLVHRVSPCGDPTLSPGRLRVLARVRYSISIFCNIPKGK